MSGGITTFGWGKTEPSIPITRENHGKCEYAHYCYDVSLLKKFKIDHDQIDMMLVDFITDEIIMR